MIGIIFGVIITIGVIELFHHNTKAIALLDKVKGFFVKIKNLFVKVKGDVTDVTKPE